MNVTTTLLQIKLATVKNKCLHACTWIISEGSMHIPTHVKHFQDTNLHKNIKQSNALLPFLGFLCTADCSHLIYHLQNQDINYQLAKCHPDLQSFTFTLPCLTWILDVCPFTGTWAAMAPPTNAFLVLFLYLCRKRRLCRIVCMLWTPSLPSGSRVIKTHIISKWTDEEVLKTGLVWEKNYAN